MIQSLDIDQREENSNQGNLQSEISIWVETCEYVGEIEGWQCKYLKVKC